MKQKELNQSKEWYGRNFLDEPGFDCYARNVIFDARAIVYRIMNSGKDNETVELNLSHEQLEILDMQLFIIARFLSHYFPEVKMKDFWSSGVLMDVEKYLMSAAETVSMISECEARKI